MRLDELFESQATKIVVVLPGRFQPPHPGHIRGYTQLVKRFGADNVYITMSDQTNPKDSPFSYDERKEIFTKLLGVPENKIIKVTKQYNVTELSKTMNLKKNSAIVFAVSKKDSADSRFAMGTKKDGSETYMRRFDSNLIEPFSKHSYVIEYPTTTFKIEGHSLNSATQIRELFHNKTKSQKKVLFEEIYGTFDERIFKLFLDKFSN